MIGTHIGNYRLVTELGAGAMGEVYFAEHAVMGRRAAIKVIREELSGNAEMVERFVNEARLVNRIGHPNIVEITDFGQVGARYYIIMELLAGETLEERLEHVVRLSEASATRIAGQIAHALEAAHGLGVIHRDLKPENVYLLQRGGMSDFVKVLDFGIAKLTGGTKPDAGTLPGTLLGTPHYMSPEQCHGSELVDPRSDVYSLGVVLYRMLTGRLPFESDSLLGLLYAQAHTPARPPRELCPGMSPRLEAIIMKALEKRAADRFQDMQSFRRALDGARLSAVDPGCEPARERAGAVHDPGGAARGAPELAPALEATHVRPSRHGQRAAAADLATDPAPGPDPEAGQAHGDPKQGQRVGSRLARILVERIHKNTLVLPVMPATARECLDLLQDADAGLVPVATAIGRDPVIAPQVLRHARSALMGGHSPTRSIEQAVSRLGARQLRNILIDVCARPLFESKDPAIRRATRGLWEHSVAVAIVARSLAQRRRDVDPEAAYLAGLLHDVGKPIAATLLLDVERSAAKQAPEWLGKDAWLDVIRECHREVGVALARSWGLQDEVVLAIARSERYSVDGPGSVASVVCLANALVKREGIYTGKADLDAVDALIREGLSLFKLEPKLLASVLGELRDQKAREAGGRG